MAVVWTTLKEERIQAVKQVRGYSYTVQGSDSVKENDEIWTLFKYIGRKFEGLSDGLDKGVRRKGVKVSSQIPFPSRKYLED